MFPRQVVRGVRAVAVPRAASRPAVAFRPLLSASRGFAAPAGEQDVRPPITVFGVDGTYATALYTAATKSSTLDPTARAMASLGNAVSKDAQLVQILSAPTLAPKDKSAIVQELAKLVGGANDTVRNFLETLAENNRLGLLPSVCAKFAALMAAARGEVEMTVTSAQPLDNRTLSRLETAVAKSSYVGQGKKLKVTNEVNSDIVGGLVVEIGDRTIDLSVSSRLAKMNKLLSDSL